MTQLKEFTTTRLKVKTFETRLQMGAEAARDVSSKIKELLSAKEFINIIFAAAPSQGEFLLHLSRDQQIDWTRINGFHMDEYIGLPREAPQTFARFLKENIFDKVPFNSVQYINGGAADPVAECLRYEDLLHQQPPDIVCMGIGENTHIAFNDPHTADFNDPVLVKMVTLDDISRQQQVNDECFDSFDEVPSSAITLTVPALLQADYIYSIVPGKNKATAVFHTINDIVSEQFPATSLKTHENAILYLDKESASKL